MRDSDLISRSALIVELSKGTIIPNDCYIAGIMAGVKYAMEKAENAPAVDAVPMEVLKQVMWERDCAIKQLEEHGIPFGGKADDVVPVVRCSECKHFQHYGRTSLLVDGKNIKAGWCQRRMRYDEEHRMLPNDFCSYGEKRGVSNE